MCGTNNRWMDGWIPSVLGDARAVRMEAAGGETVQCGEEGGGGGGARSGGAVVELG